MSKWRWFEVSNRDTALISAMYGSLLTIRLIEEKIIDIYHTDKIKSPVHLSIGQEFVSVGVSQALQQKDVVFASYRGHAAYLAKGGDINAMISEFYGKKSGCARGKAGSMHLIDTQCGMMGTTAIVATHIPLAIGYAHALKQRGQRAIVVCYHGDGAMEEGAFHESINFAALKKLPILFVCENNNYAIYSPLKDRIPDTDYIKRIATYGVKTLSVKDGDIFKVFDQAKLARQDIIENNSGPYFLDVDTYRWFNHVGVDEDFNIGYRTEEECEKWKDSDQLLVLASLLSESERNSVKTDIHNKVNSAFAFAEGDKFPSKEELYDYVTQ
jgi:TPP-dependent pyruvate/acetoin dehydrogenase alpha subunit